MDSYTGSSQAIRAVTTLIAISGNLDVQGGNVIYSPARLAKNPVELHEALSPEQAKKRLGNQFLLTDFEFTRLAHPPSGYKAILEETPYPVKAMFIMAANPLLADPNSQQVRAGLEKLDFLAVADITMSATAQLTDVVLPASTFLEQTPTMRPMRPGRIRNRPFPD
jgi:acetylene hydratase